MKIESDINNNTLYAIMWIGSFITICTLAFILTNGYNERTKAAFNGGYNETILPGSNQTAWQKAK